MEFIWFPKGLTLLKHNFQNELVFSDVVTEPKDFIFWLIYLIIKHNGKP